MNDNKIFKENINIEETKIKLTTDIKNSDLKSFITKKRVILKDFLVKHPKILKSLKPVQVKNSPHIVKLMSDASELCDVGPMAAIAGSISEISIDYLSKKGSKYSIINNGGDISFINKFKNKKVICGIYAGNSPYSNKIAFEFKNYNHPIGICSSSGSVGYSLSYGRSDCVTVISKHGNISDALATAIANEVNGKPNEIAVEKGLNEAEKYKDHFIGALIIVGKSVGTIGKLPKIININKNISIN